MPSCFKLSSALLLAAMCFLIAEVVSAEQMTTCDSDRFVVHRLNCDYGVINVQQALYGRSSSLVCSDGRPPQQLANTQCERQGTTDELSSRCNGKKTCVVNTDAFRNPDPCDGTFKYLQTNFTCLPAITVVACEESLAHLFCDVGQVISVYGADYGRRDRTTCIYKRPESQIQNVDCLRPTELVASRCNGKKSCELGLHAFRTPDPCVGTFKYLQTNFTCLEAITVVTCEGSVAYLYCGMGHVITIYGADYGRRDQTTCSYRRAPRELKNVTCLQPTALVAQMCNGKFSCSVTASNAVFTDPCKGTYKYLEISYACKSPEAHHQDLL